MSTEEMSDARDLMTRMSEKHDQVQLLLEYGDVDLARIEPAALWEDLKSVGLLDGMDKIAVVADQGWLQKVAGVASSFASAEVRTFDTDHHDQAVAWLTS